MKLIKNIAVFSLLVFAFHFSTAAEAKTSRGFELEKTSKKNSIDNVDRLKSSAFVKPYSGTNISSENRDYFPSYAKWFVSYIDFQLPHFHFYSEHATYIKQDINRCFSVSKLIFPFHLFW